MRETKNEKRENHPACMTLTSLMPNTQSSNLLAFLAGTRPGSSLETGAIVTKGQQPKEFDKFRRLLVRTGETAAPMKVAAFSKLEQRTSSLRHQIVG